MKPKIALFCVAHAADGSKTKTFPPPNLFPRGGGGLLFFSQTEVVVSGLCVLDHTQTEKQGGCDSKIKLARCR